MSTGGLVVAGNPLKCGCGVQWVGAWLRRWCAEVGAWSEGARGAARRSTCAANGAAAPLLALDADEAECHASALSSRTDHTHAPHALPALLWLIFLHALS